MRSAAILCAILALSGGPALADDTKQEGRDWRRIQTVDHRDGPRMRNSERRDPMRAQRAGREIKEEWKDGRGREFKREVKPNGDWKELRVDGDCKIEREFEKGRLKEKIDC
jgi:hypothetical protein